MRGEGGLVWPEVVIINILEGEDEAVFEEFQECHQVNHRPPSHSENARSQVPVTSSSAHECCTVLGHSQEVTRLQPQALQCACTAVTTLGISYAGITLHCGVLVMKHYTMVVLGLLRGT